jgi:hypothetical protein
MERKEKAKPPPLMSIDVVLSETKTAIDEQNARISSLDTRLGLLLSLSGVIIAALLGFPHNLGNYYDIVTKWLLAVVVIILFGAIFFATWGYWIRKYKTTPNPAALRKYLVEEQEKTQLAIIDYLESAYEWNQKRIVSKVRCSHVSFLLLLLGAIITGVTFMINLF